MYIIVYNIMASGILLNFLVSYLIVHKEKLFKKYIYVLPTNIKVYTVYINGGLKIPIDGHF